MTDVVKQHGLLSANDFLNKNILSQNNMRVRLTFEPARPSVEDLGSDPGWNYRLTCITTGRRLAVYGLDSCWLPKYGPAGVAWDLLDLRIMSYENMGVGRMRQVPFSLYGLERVSGLKTETPKLWAWLSSSGMYDDGFFSKESPEIQEFSWRLSIENAAHTIAKAQRTLAKYLAIAPFKAH
jgi:hypothetical protein